jgi:hypothetical protein
MQQVQVVLPGAHQHWMRASPIQFSCRSDIHATSAASSRGVGSIYVLRRLRVGKRPISADPTDHRRAVAESFRVKNVLFANCERKGPAIAIVPT